MKKTAVLFDWLRAEIERHDTDTRRAAYREGRYPCADRTKDLNMRYRWDLLWVAHGQMPDTLRGDSTSCTTRTLIQRCAALLHNSKGARSPDGRF